jgi:hypothetical protein
VSRYEYRVEHLQLQSGKPNEEQVVEALNKFGKDDGGSTASTVT